MAGFNQNPAVGFGYSWLNARSNARLFDGGYSDFSMGGSSSRAGESAAGYYRDMLRGIMVRTALSDYFFGEANVEHMRQLLCLAVYRMVNKAHGSDMGATVAKFLNPKGQSLQELMIIMRGIFLQYHDHKAEQFDSDPKKALAAVRQETSRLNWYVVRYLAPRMYSQAMQRITYMRDVTRQPLPLAHPESTTVTGTRTRQGPADVLFF